MISKEKYKFVLENKELIGKVSGQLKAEFIGLDGIIDEVIALISPWLFFPEAQVRPTIINLWGLTGTGKTALVKRIVELLDIKNRFLHLDLGEYAGESGTWIKSILTDELEHLHEKPSVLCFDEFQFARTLDSNENELTRDKMRVLWEIFDSGKIYYEPRGSSYFLKRADAAIHLIHKCLKKGVEIHQGEVTKNLEEFASIFSGYYFEDFDRYGEEISGNYFLSKDFIEGMKELYDGLNYSDPELREMLKQFDLPELFDCISEGIQRQLTVKQLDLSKALIFVLGNLDEAFYMSHELSPDLDADEFYAETLKINIADIKSALKKRFRNEQIARLGNNHLVYPCFNSHGYNQLISRNLERIGKYMEELIGVQVTFHPALIKIIYSEGVFPAQGVRPVLTTIRQIVESYVSRVVCEIVENELIVRTIDWDFAGQGHVITFRNEKGNVLKHFTMVPKLKLNELRTPKNDDVQLHTAIHESGHAIVAALTLRILPSLVVTKTVSSEFDGFCRVVLPERLLTKEVIRKRIMISLAGFVAEKIVLGEENTSSGVDLDIERATELANKAIKEYAMGSDPIRIHVQHAENNDLFFTKEKYVEEAMNLIQVCLAETEKLLVRNKLLLLKMSQYLTANSLIRGDEIGKMIRAYGIETWLKTEGFISKDHYYNFKQTVQMQVAEMEQDLKRESRIKIPLTEYPV
jgi:hypothetical protein